MTPGVALAIVVVAVAWFGGGVYCLVRYARTRRVRFLIAGVPMTFVLPAIFLVIALESYGPTPNVVYGPAPGPAPTIEYGSPPVPTFWVRGTPAFTPTPTIDNGPLPTPTFVVYGPPPSPPASGR